MRESLKLLLEDQTTAETLTNQKRFTFNSFAQIVVDRQKYEKDTIIIIIGDRGAGKSNWALKLIRAYIRIRHKEDPEFKWSWTENFPRSRRHARELAGKLVKSFVAHDEGGDEFYSQEGNKKVQRDLVKFMNKNRINKNLTIINWPDPHTLQKQIVNMANYLVIVPYRYRNVCSFGFLYGRAANIVSYDRFGLTQTRKKLESPTKANIFSMMPGMNDTLRIRRGKEAVEIPYPRELFKTLKKMPTFLLSHRFQKVDARFEDAYIRKVKIPKLDSDDNEDASVPAVQHEKLLEQLKVLMWNCYTKADMSYTQLERLMISPVTGLHLKSISGIRKLINEVEAMR